RVTTRAPGRRATRRGRRAGPRAVRAAPAAAHAVAVARRGPHRRGPPRGGRPHRRRPDAHRASAAGRAGARAGRRRAGRVPGKGMRIVAGAAKGRRLAPPPDGTRPTSDRVREALFNTLATTVQLDGARVLDLYAGTGAVGLPGARVVPRPVSAFLADGPAEPFDLVFADPPYAAGDNVRSVVDAAADGGWLAPEAVVVVERSARSATSDWDGSSVTPFAE